MEICGPLTLDLQYSIKKKCVHAVQDFIYLKNHLNEFNSCNFQKSEYLSENLTKQCICMLHVISCEELTGDFLWFSRMLFYNLRLLYKQSGFFTQFGPSLDPLFSVLLTIVKKWYDIFNNLKNHVFL